jgi:molybdopterin converting factor small subunit
MALTVLLAATLRKYITGYDAAGGHALEINQGTSVREVARILAIPEPEVKLIMVNGAHAEWETVLMGEERLALFPPVGGG